MAGFEQYVPGIASVLVIVFVVIGIANAGEAAKGVGRISKQLDDMKKDIPNRSDVEQLRGEIAALSKQIIELRRLLAT